ncbi:hypothetical protein EJB05_49210 [Eragrostis curvula]|uniref:NHL repeat-containing protein n=1 Tax=Eragrostis curvula TaxID=38414 RepID=A0A5J9T3Q8_9POAL|nr:hypothetical protein EJB05_49210 [Eragrostis curvula]
MAPPPFRRHPLTILPFLLLLPLLAAAEKVLEDGYAVTTVADLNHLPPPSAGPGQGLHPYALAPRPRAGDLVVLDSAGSAIYTLPILSPGEPRMLAGRGGGEAGYSDGGPGVAAFDRPRSFAVDAADNVYVADRIHGAVRKVAPSGFTTTIAGGLSSGHGHRDGPAQNATFSPDFELVYAPKICALLVTDRGNRLIRQINLKPEDCAHETHSGLGATSVSIIAVLCALLGSVIGFLARHFYPVHEISINRFFSRIQKKYKRTQRKATLISFCDIRSAIANSTFNACLLKLVRVSLGYLTVVFPSVRLERGVTRKHSRHIKRGTAPTTSLHNSSLAPAELLGDLISFGGGTGEKEDNGMPCGGSVNSQENKTPSFDGDLMELLCTPQGNHKKIDHMIETNLSDFSNREECRSLTVSSGVSRRMLHGDNKVL